MKYEAGTIMYIDSGGDGSSATALSAGAVAGVTITVIIVLLLIASVIFLVLIIYKRRNTMSANIQKLNHEMTFIKNGEVHINLQYLCIKLYTCSLFSQTFQLEKEQVLSNIV